MTHLTVAASQRVARPSEPARLCHHACVGGKHQTGVRQKRERLGAARRGLARSLRLLGTDMATVPSTTRARTGRRARAPRVLTMLARRRGPLAAAFALACAARASGAQLPSSSAAALGLGDSYTALARGADAVAWNPAGLAMPGAPRTSLALLPARGTAGLHLVALGAVAFYLDTIVPAEFNRGYVARITGDVSERGVSGFEGSVLALQRGRVGLQLASQGRSIQRIAPDPDALARFGSAGPEGRLTFDGARYDVVVSSTAALAYAHPLVLDTAGGTGRALAVGATVKYTVGHALIVGEDYGSVLTREPLELRIDFPVIESDSVFDRPENKGSGFGLDVGAAWRSGRWAAALAVRNAASTFRWDAAQFIFRPGTALFGRDSAAADFDAQAWSAAPPRLRRRLRELTFRPAISLGGAVRAGRALTLAADLRRELGRGLELAPRTHLGVGAEYRVRRTIPVRAGLAAVSGGYQASAGAGVERRGLSLALAAVRRTSPVGGATTAMIALGYARER